MSSADSALSWKAILYAQKDGYLQTALTNKGYDDAAINVLMNATNFTKSSKGCKDRTAYQVSFKNMFGRTDGNKEANAKISSEGLDGQSPNITDKKKQIHKPPGLFGGFKSGSTMFPSQMPQGKQGSNVSNAKSAYSPVKSGKNDTASNTSSGSNINSMTNKGSTSGRDKDDKSTMRMQQKIRRVSCRQTVGSPMNLVRPMGLTRIRILKRLRMYRWKPCSLERLKMMTQLSVSARCPRVRFWRKQYLLSILYQIIHTILIAEFAVSHI